MPTMSYTSCEQWETAKGLQCLTTAIHNKPNKLIQIN